MARSSLPIRLLAIDPETRYSGVAVFEGRNLLDWHVTATAPYGRDATAFQSRAREIVRRSLKRFHAQVLVVRRFSAQELRENRAAARFAQGLHVVAKREGLRVAASTATQVKQFFCQDRRATTLELARIIATEHYPFLSPLYAREQKKRWHRKFYHTRMFAAVALGLYWFLRDQGARPSHRRKG